VFDLDIHCCDGVRDPCPVLEVGVCPPVVVVVQRELECLDTPDELDGGDVGSARLAAPAHANIFAVRAMSAPPVVDVARRSAVLATVVGLLLVGLAFGVGGHVPAVIWVGATVWGLTFGGAPTLLPTALADTAGDSADSADVAISINVIAWTAHSPAAASLAGCSSTS
jgi:hypothetical protein